MKLPKVPSLVNRSETSKSIEKQDRKVGYRDARKVAPQAVRGIIPQQCVTLPNGAEICGW